jgi:hypothetical protein
MKKGKLIGGLIVLAGILGGCAHAPSENMDTKNNDIFRQSPDWVVKGSGAMHAEKGRVLYGVGSSQGVQNIPLAIEDANLRARAALSAVFSIYVDRLQRDYTRSLGSGERLAQNDESQGIEVPLEGFTHMELKGSQIVDHWQDPKSGTIFSLAAIDMKQFSKDLKGYKQMSAQMKERILKDMDQAFDKLHQAEKTHK